MIWRVRYKGPHQVEFSHIETKSEDEQTAEKVARAWCELQVARGNRCRFIAVERMIVATEKILEPAPQVPPPPLPAPTVTVAPIASGAVPGNRGGGGVR